MNENLPEWLLLFEGSCYLVFPMAKSYTAYYCGGTLMDYSTFLVIYLPVPAGQNGLLPY